MSNGTLIQDPEGADWRRAVGTVNIWESTVRSLAVRHRLDRELETHGERGPRALNETKAYLTGTSISARMALAPWLRARTGHLNNNNKARSLASPRGESHIGRIGQNGHRPCLCVMVELDVKNIKPILSVWSCKRMKHDGPSLASLAGVEEDRTGLSLGAWAGGRARDIPSLRYRSLAQAGCLRRYADVVLPCAFLSLDVARRACRTMRVA